LIVVVAMVVAACGASKSATRTTLPTVPAPATTTSAPPAPSTAATTTAPTSTVTTAEASATTLAPPPATSAPAGPPTTTPSSPAVLISKGPPDRKMVALTFDAGSDPGHAAQILDILAADHIHATFGITGVWAHANPALVRRIAAAGHQIVNHSWDHQSFTGVSTNTQPLTAAQISQELGRTQDVIRRLSGAGTNGWFRPPYGDRDRRVDAAAGGAGYRYELMWSVDTLGWKGVSPATVLQRCLAAATSGEIILMHVGSASTDAAALPAVIAAVQARGYGFAVASALV
jgi:peptidoglycan/xylan/chitin deacetylase (PgdA/CDA1 family)